MTNSISSRREWLSGVSRRVDGTNGFSTYRPSFSTTPSDLSGDVADHAE